MHTYALFFSAYWASATYQWKRSSTRLSGNKFSEVLSIVSFIIY